MKEVFLIAPFCSIKHETETRGAWRTHIIPTLLMLTKIKGFLLLLSVFYKSLVSDGSHAAGKKHKVCCMDFFSLTAGVRTQYLYIVRGMKKALCTDILNFVDRKWSGSAGAAAGVHLRAPPLLTWPLAGEHRRPDYMRITLQWEFLQNILRIVTFEMENLWHFKCPDSIVVNL